MSEELDGVQEPEDSKESNRRAAMSRQDNKVSELRREVDLLKAQLEEKKWGIDETTDPQMRGVIHQLRQTQEELAEVTRIALRSSEDPDLEPFMRRVQEEHGPEMERAYPNRIRRLEAMRTMARGLRQEEVPEPVQGKPNPRVHLTGGGHSTSRFARNSAEEDWKKFQEKMRDPKLSSEARKELADKWDADHPE